MIHFQVHNAALQIEATGREITSSLDKIRQRRSAVKTVVEEPLDVVNKEDIPLNKEFYNNEESSAASYATDEDEVQIVDVIAKVAKKVTEAANKLTQNNEEDKNSSC